MMVNTGEREKGQICLVFFSVVRTASPLMGKSSNRDLISLTSSQANLLLYINQEPMQDD